MKLKFVAHVGEVATQTVRDRRKLVGIDVIHVHRLLKNPVQVPEYVLISEELYRTGDAALSDPVHEVSHDLEGIGPVSRVLRRRRGSRGPDSHRYRIPRCSGASGRTLDLAGRGMPYMLGLRHRRRAAPAR